MKPATRRIISIYLLFHLLLMLVESLIIWLPVFFILYGGIQAVVLRIMLRKTGEAMSITKRRVIYLFTAMEVTYTMGLLAIGDFLLQDVLGIGVLPWDCLKGTLFTNPEFFHIMPGVSLTVLYLSFMVIWLAVHSCRRILKKYRRDLSFPPSRL